MNRVQNNHHLGATCKCALCGKSLKSDSPPAVILLDARSILLQPLLPLCSKCFKSVQNELPALLRQLGQIVDKRVYKINIPLKKTP